jgi:hypothetical protein
VAGHALELVTILGDDVVEHAVVTGAWQVGEVELVPAPAGYRARCGDSETELHSGASIRVPCGRGWIVATAIEPPRRQLPYQTADRRALGFVAGSLMLHFAVLAVALPVQPPQPTGAARRRLVANHVSAPRAAQAPLVTPALDREDARDLPPSPDIAVTPTAAPLPRVPNDERVPRDTAAAHDVDPCADGDCGLIATGPYVTSATGPHAGAEYTLPDRRPLDTSVVTCSPDTGCKTVSGDDQGEIRGEIARHVSDLDACFTGNEGASVAIDIHVNRRGTPTVAAHDRNAVATCVASVVGKLAFPAVERDVTLAFARG